MKISEIYKFIMLFFNLKQTDLTKLLNALFLKSLL